MANTLTIGENDSAHPAGLEELQNFDNQIGAIAIDLLMETRVFIGNKVNNRLIRLDNRYFYNT